MKQTTPFVTARLPLRGLLALLCLCAACAHAPAGVPIVAGDRVRLHYICRFPDGRVAAATEASLAGDEVVPKSPVFVPQAHPEGVEITIPAAGASLYPEDSTSQWGFEQHLLAHLAPRVRGMRPGEEKRFELTAAPLKALPPGERFHTMARMRRQPKTLRMEKALFAQRMGKTPKEGQEVPYLDGFSTRVASVEGNEVVLAVSAREGASMETPFGKKEIQDRGSYYEVRLQAQQGRLVRIGHRVGRIVETPGQEERDGLIRKIDTSKVFTIDLGLPFGGEALTCDVAVEAVDSTKP